MGSADFDKLVDMAVEADVVEPTLPLLPTLATRFNPAAYYTINGEGVWVAELEPGHGVKLSRLFSGDKQYRTASQWREDCDRGRIRQVGLR